MGTFKAAATPAVEHLERHLTLRAMISASMLTDVEDAVPLLEQASEPLPTYLLDEKLTQSLAEDFPVESIDAQSLRMFWHLNFHAPVKLIT